jgi:hypothetical protein
VPNGCVLANYGFDGGGKTLVEAGAIMGADLPPHEDNERWISPEIEKDLLAGKLEGGEA